MKHVPALTREEILAHGFPEGFIDHYRQQARVTRARAIGAVLRVAASRLRSALHRPQGRARLGDRSLKANAA